jgi:hypothetical protein
MVDGIGPKPRASFTRPLKKTDLDGKPIEMRFPVPLDAEQQKEIAELLRPLLSHGKRRVTVTCDKVEVEGLLVRESKPVRDLLVRFRESVCPKPIRLRGRRSAD